MTLFLVLGRDVFSFEFSTLNVGAGWPTIWRVSERTGRILVAAFQEYNRSSHAFSWCIIAISTLTLDVPIWTSIFTGEFGDNVIGTVWLSDGG